MTNDLTRNTPAVIAIAIGAILLLALGYSVNEILSPFLLIAAIVYLLFPFREYEIARRVLWISVAVFVVWFFHSLAALLTPAIIALLFAYIFNPLVNRLHRKMPRWAASLIVTVGVVGIVAGVLVFIMPLALRQLNGLIGVVGELAENAVEWIRSGRVFDALARFGIPVEEAKDFISHELAPKLQNILGGLFSGLFGFVTGFSSLILQIVNIIIIPFLFFYLSKDFPDIKQSLTEVLPLGVKEKTNRVLSRVDEILGQYLRGAIIVALIQGTLSTIVLALIGVNYPLVLGIMTAVLNFIPYVGLITSLIVASIVALFSGEPVFAKVVGVVALYLSQKLLEATVFGPKIVGAKVGLHPVILILSLLVFGYFLGFVGMLIAVPASALIITAFKEWKLSQEVSVAPAQTESGD